MAVDIHKGVFIYSAESHEYWPHRIGRHGKGGPVPRSLVVAGIALIFPSPSNADIGPFRIVEVQGGVVAVPLWRHPVHLKAEFPLHGHLGHLFIVVGDHWRRVGIVVVLLTRSVPEEAWSTDPPQVESFHLPLDLFHLPLDSLQLSVQLLLDEHRVEPAHCIL